MNKALISIALVLTANSSQVFASNQAKTIKDYGIRGALFPIKEESLLEVITSRLQTASDDGKLESMQEEFRNRVKEKIKRPVPVVGLTKATKSRSWTYDPTFTQNTAIKDHRSQVIVKEGTSVNPLDSIAWGEALIFIDGEDLAQIDWAIRKRGKIVLTRGAPLELSEKLKRRIYFDQSGLLTKRFKIEALPATIEQEGNRLRVNEIAIEGDN
jgi:conjugal transfer pilus assembly protein TraW